MKRSIFYIFAILLLVGSFSCQKETSFELSKNKAKGSLQKDVTSECLPKTLAGTYVAGKVLNDSNFVQVDINVTTTGSYTISTDTSNGFSFSTNGNFTTTGINTIKLPARGTPAVAGTTLFILSFDSTFCIIPVIVLPAGAGGPATFTLQGTGGACLDAVPTGNYVKNVALTSSNKVDIKVNVTAIGSYSISTTATNGMTFSGSGTFSSTGSQTVSLSGSGTPVSEGTITIPLTAGSSSCSFTLIVTATAVLTEYFPRTPNSNWSYEFDDNPQDTVLQLVITPTKTALGNTYNIFIATDDVSTGYDSAGYFRKTGGDYYQFLEMGRYIGIDSNSQWMDFNFLKDDQAAGFSWATPGFPLTQNNFTFMLRVKLTILQKNVSVVVKGTTYPNTIVIEEKYEQFAGGVWNDVSSLVGYYKNYYAKDVGLIKWEYYDTAGALDTKYQLKRKQIF